MTFSFPCKNSSVIIADDLSRKLGNRLKFTPFFCGWKDALFGRTTSACGYPASVRRPQRWCVCVCFNISVARYVQDYPQRSRKDHQANRISDRLAWPSLSRLFVQRSAREGSVNVTRTLLKKRKFFSSLVCGCSTAQNGCALLLYILFKAYYTICFLKKDCYSYYGTISFALKLKFFLIITSYGWRKKGRYSASTYGRCPPIVF